MFSLLCGGQVPAISADACGHRHGKVSDSVHLDSVQRVLKPA